MVMFFNLAVIAKLTADLRQCLILRDDATCITVRSQVFTREKTKCPNMANVTNLGLLVNHRTMGLRTIFY